MQFNKCCKHHYTWSHAHSGKKIEIYLIGYLILINTSYCHLYHLFLIVSFDIEMQLTKSDKLVVSTCSVDLFLSRN